MPKKTEVTFGSEFKEAYNLDFGTAFEPKVEFVTKPHRDLPRRMLAAVEARVKMREQLAVNAKSRARLQEANEILGILRNVVAAYERTDTPV